MSDKRKRCVLFMTFRPSQRTLFMARRNWVHLALRTHARDLHEISLDLAMVKNGLLQTLIEKLRYDYNSTTILTYESVQSTAM